MSIGVDCHPSVQQIALFDEQARECDEQQLNLSVGDGQHFYRDLQQRGIWVRVGMEATGYARWFAIGIDGIQSSTQYVHTKIDRMSELAKEDPK